MTLMKRGLLWKNAELAHTESDMNGSFNDHDTDGKDDVISEILQKRKEISFS